MIESRTPTAPGKSPLLKAGRSGCRELQFREGRHKKINSKTIRSNRFMVKAKVE
jgi:hypothetical protein